MDLPEETKINLYKNTIQYLHNIADKLPNTLNILKSYYASKFQISQLQTKIVLEKNKNKLDSRCPKCCLKLRETDASYVVKPDTRTKFAQKVEKKIESKKSLTKFQKTYLKKNDVKGGNKLVIRCNFCKKEIIHKMTKPVKPKIDFNANRAIIMSKKKKKKDKFAGLHKETVQAAQKETIGNPISKRKQRLKKKKTLTKLSNLLSQKNKSQDPQNSNLALFLEDVSTNGAQNPVEIIDISDISEEVTSLDKSGPKNLNNSISKKKNKSKKTKTDQQVFFVDKKGSRRENIIIDLEKEVMQENVHKNKTLNNSVSKNKKKSNKIANKLMSHRSNLKEKRKSSLSSFLQSLNK